MNRSLGRRFTPLALVIAAQLLIIALAPSRPPAQEALSGSTPEAATDGGAIETTDGTATSADGTTDGSTADGGTTDGGTTDGGTADGGGTDGSVAGDTSHCVAGRQFDPAIDFYAPPCVPRWGGGDNGGATYQGVTGDKITVVLFAGKGSDAVDAILKAQGAYVEDAQHQAYLAKVAKFINDHYELYGRKIELKYVRGTCDTIPPAVECLRNEMRQLVAQHKPYFVIWNTSVCSACFDELSKLRTPNAGGWHFRDSFFQLRRPYHWDVTMSGTTMAKHAGRWYCRQLHGKPARYAGSANPSQDLRDNPRKLGVISTDDPENKQTVETDLAKELSACGASFGNRKYFYEQDITTADQQRRAAVLKMNPVGSGESAATSVMCFCDLVAPSFLYSEEQQQNYYPENLLVGSGFMDADEASQAYMGAVGCPAKGARPCNFEDAFGLSSLNAQEPMFKDAGQRVWLAGGGTGNMPHKSLTAYWDYFNMVASLIQGAGPNLNPASMEAGAFKMGFRGDNTHVLRGFSPGNYAWNQDMRVVYWSTVKASSFNGEPGTYVQIGPSRIRVDGWKQGDLVLPAKPR